MVYKFLYKAVTMKSFKMKEIDFHLENVIYFKVLMKLKKFFSY